MTQKRKRKPFQTKPIQKGTKSMRGQPEHYEQVKKPTSFGITPRAKEGLENFACCQGISNSELIERFGRNLSTLSENPENRAYLTQPELLKILTLALNKSQITRLLAIVLDD